MHPYQGWCRAYDARLRGVPGYGEGGIEIVEAGVVERFGIRKGNGEFAAAMVGGSVPMMSAEGLVLALKESGEAMRYSVEDNGSAIAAVSLRTQRLRLAASAALPVRRCVISHFRTLPRAKTD